MKAFIEFGTGNYADLMPLLSGNWKDKVNKYAEFGGTDFKNYTDEWYGIFVEPMPHCINSMLNHLSNLRSNRYMMIAGVVAGETQLRKVYAGNSRTTYPNPFDVKGFGGSLINRWLHHEQYILINAITLDCLIDLSPYPVDLLRIDCEGAELEIFKSFSFNPCPRHIIIETHDRIIDNTEKYLLEIFHKHGRHAELIQPEKDVPYLISKEIK